MRKLQDGCQHSQPKRQERSFVSSGTADGEERVRRTQRKRERETLKDTERWTERLCRETGKTYVNKRQTEVILHANKGQTFLFFK